MFHCIRHTLATCTVLLLFLSFVHAEKAQLTLDLATHATGYMEWVLDAPFSAEQRQRYQEMLAQMWRAGDKGANDAVVSMARIHEKLPSLSEAERETMRSTAQKEFVRLLEAAGDDDSRWLLGIYRAAHAGAATQTSQPAPAPPASAPLGRWSTGHISSIQYQNAYTGVSAPTNGNAFAYEFKPDGTYSFTGLMQSVIYNCTTAMFSNESGNYTVAGATISFRPQANPYRITNSCAPSSNRESPGKLINRSYQFQIVQESGRRYLELRGEDGAVQKFGENQ